MRRILGVLLVVGLFVGLVVAPVATAAQGDVGVGDDRPPTSLQTESIAQSSTGNFTYFTMEGRGYIHGQEELVQDHQGVPYVWESESMQTRLTLEPRPSTNTKRVCGRILDENHEVVDEIGCTSWNSSSRRKRATLELSAWPAGAQGTHYLAYEYVEEVPRNESGGSNGGGSGGGSNGGDGQQYERVVHDRYQTEVYVISKQGDLDDDGLSNAREVAEGTDFTRQDTDGDGVSDRAEVFQYGSDPLKADTTGDGIGDGTIASLGLPPTVPYIVHVVVLGGFIAVVAVAVGSLKLWQLLQESGGPGSPPPTQQASSPPADPSGPPGGAAAAADGAPTSKEEEVFRVIHEHGGQMRQADLVDETEWSKATVSRLLSTLEEEGRVEKIRVGRGNVVRITDGAAADANAAGTSQGSG